MAKKKVIIHDLNKNPKDLPPNNDAVLILGKEWLSPKGIQSNGLFPFVALARYDAEKKEWEPDWCGLFAWTECNQKALINYAYEVM